MATSGGATANLAGGTNQVRSVKTIGVNPNSAAPAAAQQAQSVVQTVQNQAKGANISVRMANAGGAAEQFLLFDPIGTAAYKGATANGADITFYTTFIGGGAASAYNAGLYAILNKYIAAGSRMGSVGTIFTFGNVSDIAQENLTMWNGNIENYNSQNLQNYLTLAQDTYANQANILVMNTVLWINPLLAITGQIPAGGSLNILFNINVHGNW